MCDDHNNQGVVDLETTTVSRRDLGLLGVGAAAAVGVAGSAHAAAANVVERDVEVRTADGVADAVLFYPQGQGSWAGVLIWPDALGLRPVFREMGRRLASQGYTVLVPNPFYRVRKAPVLEGPFNFANPDDRAKLGELMRPNTPEAMERDSRAYIAFLDAQPQTNKAKKVGVQGYCMGGPLSVRTAAAVPNRIGAVGSFHGGGLVTPEANSPHLLIPRTNARYIFAVAQNDDQQDPNAKNTLRTALQQGGKQGVVEVYPANHGWCVRGAEVYNEAQAERAWAALSDMYRAALA